MEFVELHGSLRQGRGKGFNKKLREKGFIPAILYKKGEDSVAIMVERKDFLKAIHTQARDNVIVKLYIDADEEKNERTVIIKELQKDPVKDSLLHIDFQEVSLTETLRVKVPITAKGEAIGVKQDGGVLQHVLWEVRVEASPVKIPEKIELDVTNLKIGDIIHVADIVPPEGVKILDDSEGVVFSVEHIKTVEEVVAPPSEGEIEEPELIRQKKERPEEEEGERPVADNK